jgi:hypothetical protein
MTNTGRLRGSNRHAADMLHDLRCQIKTLEAQEQELRDYLLMHPEDLCGADYEAVIASQLRRRVDLEGLAQTVGAELMARFTSRTRVVAVRVRHRRSGGRA